MGTHFCLSSRHNTDITSAEAQVSWKGKRIKETIKHEPTQETNEEVAPGIAFNPHLYSMLTALINTLTQKEEAGKLLRRRPDDPRAAVQ